MTKLPKWSSKAVAERPPQTSDDNEGQHVRRRCRRSGGHVERRNGSICLPARIQLLRRRLPANLSAGIFQPGLGRGPGRGVGRSGRLGGWRSGGRSHRWGSRHRNRCCRRSCQYVGTARPGGMPLRLRLLQRCLLSSTVTGRGRLSAATQLGYAPARGQCVKLSPTRVPPGARR